MNLSDQELELLDRYLDGDLADAELVGLEARLKSDAAMSSELGRLRELRAMRVEAFAAMEPTEVEAQQLQWYVRGALNQQKQETRPVRDYAGAWMRGLSRVAAVLVIGFVVGYFYRGGTGSAVQPQVAGPTAVRSTPSNPAIDLSSEGPLMMVPDGRNVAGFGAGSIMTVANNIGEPMSFDVALTDQRGNLIAKQRFATLQEAQQFASEVNRVQQKQRQLQNGGVRLIGDGF